MSLNILMVDDATIKARTGVHDNIDPKLIYPEILNAQDLYILPIVGTALYNRILNDISNSTLAGDYKNLVDNYLLNTLLNYVMSELPLALNYQFWNRGVTTATTDNSQTPTMADLLTIASTYKNRAEAYQSKAIKFLLQNTNLYPEYLNPGSGIDTVVPARYGFSSPIYLGEPSPRRKRSYEEKYQGNIFRFCDDCY